MPPVLTPAGLEIDRLEDIKAEMEGDLRTALGQGINLEPTESLGVFVGTWSERYALSQELAQDIYNSMDPDNCTGVSQDRRFALTNHTRLAGNKSKVTATLFGTEGTFVDVGDLTVSVQGKPDAVFVNVATATIGPGTDEVQEIEFSSTPDEGSFTLIFNGEETDPIPFGAVAADVEDELNDLASLEGITVSGSFAAGFVVTFEGPFTESPQPLIEAGVNSLETSNVPVVITITEQTAGVFPNVDVKMEATVIGPIQAKATTLTVIETPIVGVDSVINALDAVPGRNVETQAEFWIRRKETLAIAGSGTLDAIAARLRAIDEVLDVARYQNYTETPDSEGRPSKSMEFVVLGGDAQKIAKTIWDFGVGGIRLVGNTVENITDSQGTTWPINFSRPNDLDIWVIAEIEPGPDYPVDGDALVVDSILKYAAENQRIGKAVINKQYVCPVVDVPGVLDVNLKMGTAPAPTLEDNIAVDDREHAKFDSSRISVVHI